MSTPPPPPRGSLREQTLYAAVSVIWVIDVLILVILGIITQLVPVDICAAGWKTWQYWSLMPQASLSILASAAVSWLLWHTLWRGAHWVTMFLVVGTGALNIFSTIWYIQYNNSCDAYSQCWGLCAPGPEFPITNAFITFWALVGALGAIRVFYVLAVIVIGSYTSAQGLLWWAYGATEGPFNYYARMNAPNAYGYLPDNYPAYNSISETASARSSIESHITSMPIGDPVYAQPIKTPFSSALEVARVRAAEGNVKGVGVVGGLAPQQ